MNVVCSRKPGVVEVKYFDIDKYKNQYADAMASHEISSSAPSIEGEIPIIQLGSCEVSQDSCFCTAVLKFMSPMKIRISKHLGFMFKDDEGDSWIIGTSDMPYPQIAIKESFGDHSGAVAGFSYEIRHIDINTPVKVG